MPIGLAKKRETKQRDRKKNYGDNNVKKLVVFPSQGPLREQSSVLAKSGKKKPVRVAKRARFRFPQLISLNPTMTNYIRGGGPKRKRYTLCQYSYFSAQVNAAV